MRMRSKANIAKKNHVVNKQTMKIFGFKTENWNDSSNKMWESDKDGWLKHLCLHLCQNDWYAYIQILCNNNPLLIRTDAVRNLMDWPWFFVWV